MPKINTAEVHLISLVRDHTLAQVRMTGSAQNHGDTVPAPPGLIGFGEAATAFVEGWQSGAPALAVSAYDIKTDSRTAFVSTAKWQDYRKAGVNGQTTLAGAIGTTGTVFSLVTADQALVAAQTAAGALQEHSLYFDCNSCAPETKRAAAAAIEAAGGRYVDVAVMAPVHPGLHKTPLLISGPHTIEAQAALTALGMRAEVAVGDVGRASSIKMMRSVMVKGLEALVLESVLAARKAGVDGEVLASLDATFPGFDWAGRAAYMMERVTTHGLRRAAEMREVARTISDLDLPPVLSDAITQWQGNVGALTLPPGPDDYTARADAILAALSEMPNHKDD